MQPHLKDVSLGAMNSFVHGGIHSLAPHRRWISHAVLAGNPAITKPMSAIQPEFADCLPELLRRVG